MIDRTPLEFTVHIRHEQELWWATSPQIPGLMASGKTVVAALEDAAKEVSELALACAWQVANGETATPIFKKG